mmetsp:Transcript_24203/g.33821  ORF Transcript_24203/g.33821 Transcript_24203/m.33821 type:complete len:86 (+) Transcript_24203:139-396(+)
MLGMDTRASNVRFCDLSGIDFIVGISSCWTDTFAIDTDISYCYSPTGLFSPRSVGPLLVIVGNSVCGSHISVDRTSMGSTSGGLL